MLLKLTGFFFSFLALNSFTVIQKTGERWNRKYTLKQNGITRRMSVCFQRKLDNHGSSRTVVVVVGSQIICIQSLTYINTLDYQTSQLPWEKGNDQEVRPLIWTEKKHLRYIVTKKIQRRPDLSKHTHLNSTRIWHCTSSQRRMISFHRHVFTHLSASFCSFKEKPIFHTNMLSWVFWICDFR